MGTVLETEHLLHLIAQHLTVSLDAGLDVLESLARLLTGEVDEDGQRCIPPHEASVSTH